MHTRLLTLSIWSFLCTLAPSWLPARQSSQYEEVIFGFTLKDLGSYNISVAVKDDRIYLPVMELFNIFEVYYTIEGQNIIQGTYLSSAMPMKIDPVKRVITLEDKRYDLAEGDILKGEMDIYLSTEKFEEIFGITSTVNINRLQIIAETTKELPALVRKRTVLERSEMRGGPLVPVKYPVRYDLQRSLLEGAVLDYNVTTSLNRITSQGTSYTLTGGGEVAGGDLQGSLIGGTGQISSVSDMRWRYVVRENEYFSSLAAGQVTTGSDLVPRVTGVALSNEPVEPRVMFDNYVVDGYTEPESDVELYINDRLIGFQKANAAGYYRFQFPLTYGTARIGVKTFSKYGDINVDEKQIQVPFSFVPEGVLSYNLGAGKADKNVVRANDVYFGNASVLYGASNWLTLNGGLQGSSRGVLRKPVFDAGLSSRFFSQYIVNVDVAPDAYYRLNANALFATNAGVFAQYSKYVLSDSLIGTSPQQNASLAVYLPVSFVSTGTAFRFSEDYVEAASGKRLSPRIDLATRLTDLQLLLTYREVMTGADVHPLNFGGNGLFTTTAMYTLPRGSILPEFLQAFLLRGQATYDLQAKVIQDATLQFSKTFFQIFQFNLGFDRNFTTRSTSVQAGLIMDLNVTRTSSVFNASQGTSTQRHSVYGSVAVDHNTGSLFLSNREEVDKGGIDVLLFVDNNDNGAYDASDELIPARGVKVDGMGKVELGRDSVVRVSQLQSYFRYNLEVDRQQIDPNLVPTIDKFSFVVDPNQFRRIEIPFYRGGTVSGTVYLDKEGMRNPLSGTRVIMRSTEGASGDTLRTFADGGFYSMNVAPGSYTLSVDSTQLRFLGATQENGPLSLTVHRSPQGDIIDTLEIIVVPGKSQMDVLKKENADLRQKNTELEGNMQKLMARLDSLESRYTAQKQNADSLEILAGQAFRTENKIGWIAGDTTLELVFAQYEDALLAFMSKKYDDAAAAFQKIANENIPNAIEDHCRYWIGESKFAAKEYSQALWEFQEVLTFERSPKRADAQFMVGRCYEGLGDNQKAKEAFQQVVNEYPNSTIVAKAREHLARL